MLLKVIGRIRQTRGFTAIETITSVSIFTILAMGGVSLMVAAAASWNREIAQAGANTDSSLGVRTVARELRSAMSVTVDFDGQGISYTLPRRDSSGRTVFPLVSDGVNYRYWRSSDGRSLMRTGHSRPLITDLPPEEETGRLFALQSSGKSVRIALTSKAQGGACDFESSKTEVVRLRNAQ